MGRLFDNNKQMDFRRNEDWLWRRNEQDFAGASQGSVLDVVYNEESSGDNPVLIIPRDEVKNFCKMSLDIIEDDQLIDEIQLAAITQCEGLLNIGFRERSITALIDNRNGGMFLPYGPIGTIVTIKAEAPIDKQVSGTKWKQILWPYEDRLEVVYTGGYATLPYILKLGLLQCIYFMYDERKRRDEPMGPIYLETLKPHSRNV